MAKRSKYFAYAFMGLGLLIQVVTYFVSIQYSDVSIQQSAFSNQMSVLSLISGCLGVCSVCLAAQGNILTYAFGFAQVLTYTWLCVTQRFYGEIAINAYYFLTMIYGVFAWRKRLKVESPDLKTESLVTPRSLPLRIILLIAAATLVVSGLTGWGLAAWTDDTQPYLDAFTTIPALVAQVLMILVYREHWFLWLAVDMLSVVLWWRAGDYCMVAQYAFWCMNCLYGLKRWKALNS
ncbi:MAG: nicotinamide mononucleotide transporter [Paludibacteraceae bacterium]|nr:nicotinamide mononucleotide transporter [Paludibacteraceae bacterium]